MAKKKIIMEVKRKEKDYSISANTSLDEMVEIFSALLVKITNDYYEGDIRIISTIGLQIIKESLKKLNGGAVNAAELFVDLT